jgi:hypothetical protein
VFSEDSGCRIKPACAKPRLPEPRAAGSRFGIGRSGMTAKGVYKQTLIINLYNRFIIGVIRDFRTFPEISEKKFDIELIL